MKSRFGALISSAVGFAAGHTIATQSPVEKVVKLLTDIKTRIETDGGAEQQMYDKFACWCDTTSKRKAASIIQANEDIRAMGQQILSLKGRIATRTAEIEHLTGKLKANAAEQERATVLRSKDNKAYMEETAEIKQSVAALEQAVKALVAGTTQGGASLLQAQATGSLAVRNAIQSLPDRVSLKPEQMSLLSEFATGSLSAERYAPQSATIQGMLADMYATFATDLEESIVDEARQNRQFESLMATLETEAIALRATKQKKEEELVDAETLLADTTQSYDDTEAQKKADIEFFDETKATCFNKAEEWTTRKEMRAEELAGINEGLEILTSDDARELFAKAIKPGKETGADSFMQISSDENENAPLEHAYTALKAAATKSHSFRLAQLAVTVRTTKSGHFDAVIVAIDEIYQNLKDENNADIAKRDQCKEKNQEITSTVADLDWKMSVNQANIDKLAKQIENREAEKAKTLVEIEDMATQIAGMEEQRKLDHETFLATKSDDEGAIALLHAAKEAIAKFYKDKKESLLQQGPDFEVSADQAPSSDFSGRDSRKGEGKGVLSLMKMLIEDLDDEVTNGVKNEAKEHEEFEKMLASAKKVKEDLITKTTNLEEIIAKRGEKKTEEHTDKGRNQDDKTSEIEYKAEIKPDCDFILRSFHDRALQRGSEMDGLLTAKSMLQGAKPAAALIEQGFDDNAFSGIRFLGVK